jgi:hypothetical protein
MYSREAEVLNTNHHFTSQEHVLSDARVTHTREVLMPSMLCLIVRNQNVNLGAPY